MKWLKTYKLFETDGTFMYDPSFESKLPEFITVIKGNQKDPNKMVFKKGIIRHIGPEIQIPYETTNKEGGRENPDTLEFDIYYDFNINHQKLSINIEVNYGDLTACQFSIESPNKVNVIRYTSLHSKDDDSNTVFALDNKSLQSLCDYINEWDHGIMISPKDLKFLDMYDNYTPI